MAAARATVPTDGMWRGSGVRARADEGEQRRKRAAAAALAKRIGWCGGLTTVPAHMRQISSGGHRGGKTEPRGARCVREAESQNQGSSSHVCARSLYGLRHLCVVVCGVRRDMSCFRSRSSPYVFYVGLGSRFFMLVFQWSLTRRLQPPHAGFSCRQGRCWTRHRARAARRSVALPQRPKLAKVAARRRAAPARADTLYRLSTAHAVMPHARAVFG